MQICRESCRRALWLNYVLKSEIECRLSHLPPQILKNVLRFSTFGDIFQDNWKLCVGSGECAESRARANASGKDDIDSGGTCAESRTAGAGGKL